MWQNGKYFSESDKDTPKKRNRLVIEENTIYEIDEDCYQCLMKRQKKRVNQQNKENC